MNRITKRYGEAFKKDAVELLLSGGKWNTKTRINDQLTALCMRITVSATPVILLKPYLYRGLFRCGECGCFITTETQKGHNYLRCTKRVVSCTQKYVREEAIAIQVDRAIERAALKSIITGHAERANQRNGVCFHETWSHEPQSGTEGQTGGILMQPRQPVQTFTWRRNR